MESLARLGACCLATVVAAGLYGCAAQRPVKPVAANERPPFSARADQTAMAARAFIGRPRHDVRAALGDATAVRFDSGYEVWVYRFVEPTSRKEAGRRDGVPARRQGAGDDRPSSELVILFAPSGVVTKMRVRSPDAVDG